MAGPRRSKRLESCSKPGQDKDAKIARVSKDQQEAVPGQNTKMGESAAQGPSDSGVDRTWPQDASPTDAERELWGKPLSKEEMQVDYLAIAEQSRLSDDGLDEFRRAIQRDAGLGYLQHALHDEWGPFNGLIVGFTEEAGFGDLSWDRLDEAVQQRFIGYSPCAQQLFETPVVRQFMFQRWIWEIIDECFFTGKSQDIEWTSPYWEAQAAMEGFLREKNFRYDEQDLRFQYPNWRFTTINFYYSLGLRDNDNRIGYLINEIRIEPRCVTKILKKALGQYFPENPSPLLEKDISTLVKLIAEFELILDSGRHTPRLVFHDPNTNKACGFPFSARAEGFGTKVVMESVGLHDEALCNGLPVELVVSPMLVLYGHKDGWDYHVPYVVVPLRVCVGYIDGFSQDEIETEEDVKGGGEEEVEIIKDKEVGKGDGDEKKIEDEE